MTAAMRIAGSALDAQSKRLLAVSENIANAQSTATVAGGDPYRRKTVTFAAAVENGSGHSVIDASRVGRDPSSFRLEYDPAHPAADAKGMVKLPNVNVLVEMADMREANRSYEANLQVMAQVRELVSSTIELMRGTR